MADIIEFIPPIEEPAPRSYSIEVFQYPDDLMFTVKGVRVSPASLRRIADELDKIAQIIRSDVVTGVV